MSDRRRIAGTVALAAGISLLGVVVAFIVVVLIANISPEFALSDGFFWASAVALVVVHLAAGTVAGRVAGARLAQAGLEGRARLGFAVLGPAFVALVTNLKPVEDIPVVVGILAPVMGAVSGVVVGVWLSDSRDGGRVLT